MADVKWIKITTDIFDDEKILLIESMPDAYAIITVWFKLLCLAGKQNNSGVFMMGRIPYTYEMLATIFRMNKPTVTLALHTFEKFGMVEIVDGVITIPNWEKHQSLDKLQEARENTRQRVAKHRAKQKQLAANNGDVTPCNVTVTRCNALDKEEDKERDTDKEIYISIVDYLNAKVGTSYRPTTKKTQSCIRARLDEGFTVDDFKTVIDKKAAEWIGTEYEQYLRPETLFGTKFESYLNAKVRKPTPKPQKQAAPSGGYDDFMAQLAALREDE